MLLACHLPVLIYGINMLSCLVRLGQVFKFDPASAAALSAEVRGHVCDEERGTGYHPTVLADAGGCMNHDVRRIWAMIEVSTTVVSLRPFLIAVDNSR